MIALGSQWLNVDIIYELASFYIDINKNSRKNRKSKNPQSWPVLLGYVATQPIHEGGEVQFTQTGVLYVLVKHIRVKQNRVKNIMYTLHRVNLDEHKNIRTFFPTILTCKDKKNIYPGYALIIEEFPRKQKIK